MGRLNTFRSNLVSDLIGKRKKKKEEEESRALWDAEKIKEAFDKMSVGGKHPNGSPYMKNILGIRKSNLVYQYSNEEKEEMVKCSEDIKYFAEKYCQIKNKGVYSNFKLRDYQIDLLDLMQSSKRTVIKASRQTGKCHLPDIYIIIKTPEGDIEEILFQDFINRYQKKKTNLQRLKGMLWKIYSKLK